MRKMRKHLPTDPFCGREMILFLALKLYNIFKKFLKIKSINSVQGRIGDKVKTIAYVLWILKLWSEYV